MEIARTCGDPGKVAGSTYDFTLDVLPSSAVVYTCDKGYRNTAGNLTRICQAGGIWSGVKPVCTITCGDPGKVSGSIYNYTSDVIPNLAVKYTCDEGYKNTAGNLTRICQAGGKWSGVKPVCKRKNGASCHIPGGHSECVPNAVCGVDFKCSCRPFDFYDNEGLCPEIISLGDKCRMIIGNKQCQTSAECIISGEKTAICKCKEDFYENVKKNCVNRPGKPVITFLSTTNETVSFTALFNEEDRKLGIYVSYVSSNGWSSTEQTFTIHPNSTYIISNLTAGTCYNFTFLSFLTSNDKKSRHATKITHCTVPNPPLYVEVKHINNTEVSLSIVSGTGNVDMYYIVIENVTMFETSQLENGTIIELEPGYQYVANVWAISNGLNSSLYNVTIITYPDSPLSLSVIEQTTTTFKVDVFHGRGFVQFFDVYISNKFKFRGIASAGETTRILIQQLYPGKEYKTIEIKAVSHDLTSNSTELPPTATYPNPPSHVEVRKQSTTSVSLSIFNGTGNFDKYFVLIENVTFMNASYLENVEIENLDPGNQYIAQVGVTSNGLNSTVNVTIHTYPDRPQSVDVIDQTTESIVINITQGQGMVQFFFIRINSTYNVTGRQGQTTITLKNLIPGTLLTEITVQAVSYELFGEIKQVTNTSTLPAAPKSANVTIKTIDSFNITIAHGNGMVEYFYIQIDGITYQDQAAVKSDTTEVKIPGLIPGTLYTNISVISVSNGLNATLYEIPSCATYPDIPKSLDATDQTNTTLSLKIGHGKGVSKSFYIYVDGKLCLKNDVIGETAVTSVVLSNLTAGTLYNVSVQTVSNNLRSEEKHAKPHATNPNVPSDVKVTNQSEKTIELNIYHGSGSMQCFEIYLNDTFKYTIPPHKDDKITVYTIPNLIPGTCYRSIYIRSTAYGLKSLKKAVESHSTNPAAPSTITSTTQTTDTIDLNIVHGEGNVDYYIIHVNASYKVNTTANRNAAKTEITLDKLIPGIMYDKIKIEAFSNNLRSNTKNVPGYATKPSAPSLKNINSSREVIQIWVKKGRGSVEKYVILVNSKSHSNVTYTRETQQVNITGRTPGELYNITAIATSNNQESTLSSYILTATYPPVPHFNIVGIGSSEINMTVALQPVGHVDIYNASFESKETRANCKSNSFTTKLATPTSATVDNLTPGAKYEITVSTISNSLTSFSETKKTIVTS
ncbi:Hypothetical predicted protein [Mytilus galloprovincialis]|uniref:Uncharacterized protein n=1 Tax=Mytilus galloprovincialis TaxID=29158 RepID=A0A8B6CD06_MYTGA|nr:Hypothetical predicted protein [Mytilus galloprovincialis]